MSLSNTDIRILRFVSGTGINETEKAIAKRLRLSQSTLVYKLREFEDEKVIACYR